MPVNTINRTTLTAAAAQNDRFVVVASATNITAGDVVAGTPASIVYIVDPGQKVGEVATVISVSGTTIGLRRVTFVVPHASGSTVYHGPPDNFYEHSPRGSAVNATAPVNMWINTLTGDIFQPSASTLTWLPAGTAFPATITTASAQAATATLTTANFGKVVTNTGASGAIVLTLPTAAAAAGQSMKVQLTVAQTVTLTPVTGEVIWLGASGVASKYALIAGVIGNYVTIYSDGSAFFITDYAGVVTKEA